MPLQRLIIVQPCYSLEDLPRNLDQGSAADYHACWTSLWHPAFLVTVSGLPEWKRSDSSSLDVQSSLILVPKASESHLDSTLRERIELGDNLLLHSLGDRQGNLNAVAQALGVSLIDRELVASFESVDIANSIPPRSPITCRSFFALGFAYLQLHVLTRKVHYNTNLDQTLFHEQVTQAAQGFLNDDAQETERWLQSCYDQISQERDRYFSQQANLIDLTLVVGTTLGSSMIQQLQQQHEQNFLISADNLSKLKSANPDAFEFLVSKANQEEISIAGGLEKESAHPWLGQGTLLRDLRSGIAAYETLGLKQKPTAFSRLTGGVRPNDAQLYRIAGYPYAVLSAWLDGALPRSDQAKIRWQSADGSTIDAIAAFISDANSALNVLSSGVDLAKQFDYHQVPTLLFAHWPNDYSEAFIDLRLATERTTAFGKWITLARYFEETGQAYSNTTLPTSQFKYSLPTVRDSYLRFCNELQTVRQRIGLAESIASFAALLLQLCNWMKRKQDREKVESFVESASQYLRRCDVRSSADMNAFVPQIAGVSSGWAEAYEFGEQDEELSQQLASLAGVTSGLLSGKSIATNDKWAIGSERSRYQATPTMAKTVELESGVVTVINPSSAPQRYWLRAGKFALTSDEENRVYAAEESSSAAGLFSRGLADAMPESLRGGNEIIVDVPAMGVAQFKCAVGSSVSSPSSVRRQLIAASAKSLTNEFLDVQLDPSTGHLRSLLVARKRGSRMSGQLTIADAAFFTTDVQEREKREKVYATIRDVSLTLEHNSTMSAIVSAKGTLVHKSLAIAKFTVLYELWRGSRCLQITPKVEWLVERVQGVEGGTAGFWAGVPVWRTAWPSDAATLRTWPQTIPTKAASATVFCPDVMEVDDAEHRLHLMFGGQNVHARQESRYLDTHLGNGESGSILAGIDLPDPLQAHAAWCQKPLVFSGFEPLSANQSSAIR